MQNGKGKAQSGAKMSTREGIKAAARELFIRHGINDVTYSDIAKQVGTARANLHYHFGSKAALVDEVFRETFESVDATNREIWLSPGLTLDERIERTLEDSRQRFYELNESEKDRNPWSLSSRSQFGSSYVSDDVRRGITKMSRQFEEYVDHAVRLAIGSGELRFDTRPRTIVLLLTPLWYFGSAITQYGGFHKLEEHYQSVRQVIRDGYRASAAANAAAGDGAVIDAAADPDPSPVKQPAERK